MTKQKEIVKTSLKFLKNSLLAIIAGVVFYLAGALLFSLLPTHPPQQNCLPEHEIFIASNGIHLDIIFPVENIEPQLLQSLDVLPGTLFIGFGWGDKEFYIKTPLYDNFYDATGSFSIFHTCNVWVNVALKEIEVKTSVWSPFDFEILYHLKNEK